MCGAWVTLVSGRRMDVWKVGGRAVHVYLLAGWVESTGVFFSFLPRALLLSLPSLPQGT